ncbi:MULTISPECIES: ABC transporter permease [unclassified Mycolicibacterium]|uniref:ABC transporter permease n=1 Tax=unclassified Mycolicibacterium TaxID=2636767 RepID=UPI0012DF9508|nr:MULTISPECIES: FtsX-like permease family protein [unclassified Mycolicibacterium]MUL81328.1 FtsX-like permease family protein [Mycolicibacterium sp. CBMA 329]MUL87094.1 FtsX-like permease family protein [Mycolicibacterium sp. CBMA 331]MUL98624.1 FtsX-like permease family protein [Mycolicibacterium sp. CBMA 334]MUM29501.1 FtsX-like permease family protein [Mycolicibacterium sp. CBMA 295]MUM37391.1 FtsX-like permease family protein [Mycolicibacterium sp. CBMA 247]
MRKLRAGWLSFRRIHLSALIADWRRTLLSMVGVAVGVAIVLGTLILKVELNRPFDAFGPSLTHAADRPVVEVVPNISGRLPVETVDELHAKVTRAAAVIPVVAGLTPISIPGAGATHGFFLLGGSCQIELLVGSFNCEQRARAGKAADGPGVPIQIPTVIAQRHGLGLGDELHIPGLPAGSAHVGWTFPEFDRVQGINGGYVMFAPSTDVAAGLLGTPGYATAAFVIPEDNADITADVDRVITGVATAGPPRPHLPAMLENGTQSFNLTVLAGVLIGCLIAVNTILLAVEDRRAVMGTIGAIGAKPAGLFGGMIGEGAAVGLFGGLLGVPGGFLLGTYLVDTFGRSMLSGSGGIITTHFTPSLIVIGAVAGVAAGVLAMIGPALRLVREGPLASMASAGGVQRVRTIPVWPLPAGIIIAAGALVLMKTFERGSLPLNVGINGMTAGLYGVILVTVWFAPRGAEKLIDVLTVARPDIGRLLRADVRRYALLFALSAAILVDGTGLAIGSQSMQLLGTAQVAAEKADRLPSSLLVTAQSVLDQRDGHIAESTFEQIATAADGHEVSSRWRSTISSGTLSRLVIGVTPGSWYSRGLYQPIRDDDRLWNGLQDGQIGLSQIAASRLGVTTGGTVELPTVHGHKQFQVAGIFHPRMIDDTAVGDIVLTSDSVARSDWAAVRDQVAVQYPSPADATAHRDDFAGLDAGLAVYDNEQWRSAATSGLTRFLKPFTIAGYVVMAAAGLSVLNVFVLGLLQRKRERAVLRAIGATRQQEQAVIVAYAALLGLIVAVAGGLGGIGLTYLWTLGSPVYYGIKVDWAVLGVPLLTAVTAVMVLILAAAVYPVTYTRKLETADVLRAG